ncbi:helix-hairpin-helix domain-containing protein [Pseudomonas koreensis]|uniref:ComEA family DNA-binding protein n=1 Tax=Pseudomonas koreensis TaxID=198620 RepID=UPI002FC58F86
MRTGYFYSLIFAILTSASIAAIAAPVAPSEGATAPVVVEPAKSAQSAKIDLNDADAATLQKELAGVGEAKAQAIVAYRETNGPFSSVDELLEVKGIGKAILDRNRDKLEVN